MFLGNTTLQLLIKKHPRDRLTLYGQGLRDRAWSGLKVFSDPVTLSFTSTRLGSGPFLPLVLLHTWQVLSTVLS